MSATDAKITIESGATLFNFTAATTGDQQVYTVAGKTLWSKNTGSELEVVPNGVVTGLNMLSTNATDDTVTIAGFTANSAGTLFTVTATTDTITRPATDVAKVCSIAMDNAGAIAVIAGTDSTDTSFDDDGRGGAGQPPYIPVDSVEIGQVRVVTSAAGVIAASEFFQTTGTHAERFDFPRWAISYLGEGDKATTPTKRTAHVEFDSIIGDAIHTADAYKKVYIKGYTPVFSELFYCTDFVPAEETYSGTSTQYYKKSRVSSSSSLGTAGFTHVMEDGITDLLAQLIGQTLITKFWPDENKVPYQLTQGIVGKTTSNPSSGDITAAATIVAETETINFSS